MKYLSHRAARNFSLGAFFFVASVFAGAPQIARAQNAPATTIPPISTLQSDHRVLDASGQFVLTLKNSPFASAKLRIGVFRVGQTQKLAETRRDFTLQNGELHANFQLNAPPGDYELRILGEDKNRTPLHLISTVVTVAGMRREPGWWLFNGQAFVTATDENSPTTSPNAPLFIAGLKRDFGKKPKPISRSFNSNETLQYRVLELPSLEILSDPKYDFAALKTKVVAQIDEARKNGACNLAGFELPLGVPNRTLLAADAKVVVGRVRQILNEVAPDAALIFQVDPMAAMFRLRNLETYAPLCDAAILETNSQDVFDLWEVKNLRRAAEEQPNFDLPILARNYQNRETKHAYSAMSDSHAAEMLMSGATGFIEYSNDAPLGFKSVVNRNLPLFVGSVTLEDIGVLNSVEWFPGIAPTQYDAILGGHSAYFFNKMREAGRIPLAARLPDLTKKESERKSESLMVSFETRISNDTIEKLRAAASAGNRVYIEGAPTQDENGKEVGWRLGSLVGGEIQKTDYNTDAINLQDGWMFGTLRGTKLNVSSSFKVTLNNGSVAPRTKEQKGLDILLKPRVAATLNDGSPALVINPVGKGEVVWLPFRVLDFGEKRRTFYQAISNYIEPSLVTLRVTDSSSEMPHLALRRSARGALILGIFNDSARDTKIAATVAGVAGTALDLNRERELPLFTRGNETEVSVTVAAHGFALVAFAVNRKTLDDERNDFSGKVRLK